jgi:thioredoxin reductase
MRHDAIVIGGSFAGLSAATYIARARRTVCVVDAGAPRNRFAAHGHGFFTQDGSDPRAMIAAAREQVAAYPTVAFVQGIAARAEKQSDGFVVTLESGEVLEAAKLVLAFGISDELPPIPGLSERWGVSVLHCPYCHGYEVAGRRLGVLHLSAMSAHQALLIAEWGPATYFLNGAAEPEPAVLAALEARGVGIERARVSSLHGDERRLESIALADGRSIAMDALFLGPRTHLNSDLASQLGCELHEGPFGRFIKTDEWKATSAPGVYAAGDITRAAHTATWASSDGVTAGIAVHRALVFPG